VVTEHTVEKDISNIFQKLRIESGATGTPVFTEDQP
jgi:DNA-binding NarL/FixJ family response regulator